MATNTSMTRGIEFPNLERVLEEYAIEVRNKYQDSLIRNNRIATGDLLNTVEYEVVRDGSIYRVSLILEDYWYYVENGRNPGKWPPRDEILDWIRIKPVLPTPDSYGNLPTPESLAFLIQRKIGEEGTEGSHDLDNAVNDIWPSFQQRIQEAIEQDVTDIGLSFLIRN